MKIDWPLESHKVNKDHEKLAGNEIIKNDGKKEGTKNTSSIKHHFEWNGKFPCTRVHMKCLQVCFAQGKKLKGTPHTTFQYMFVVANDDPWSFKWIPIQKWNRRRKMITISSTYRKVWKALKWLKRATSNHGKFSREQQSICFLNLFFRFECIFL